jgi:hypothetical protein
MKGGIGIPLGLTDATTKSHQIIITLVSYEFESEAGIGNGSGSGRQRQRAGNGPAAAGNGRGKMNWYVCPSALYICTYYMNHYIDCKLYKQWEPMNWHWHRERALRSGMESRDLGSK